MRSRHGRDPLQTLTHGSTIPIVSKKAFARTLVPAMTPRLQKSVAAHARKKELSFRRRDEILPQIEELRDTYLD